MTTINFNNANTLRNFPLDKDFMDYSSGTGSISDVTVSSTVFIQTTTTKLTSGSAFFDSNNVFGIQMPSTTISAGGLTIAFWAKLNSIVSIPTFIFFEMKSTTGTASNYLSIFYDATFPGGIKVSTTDANAGAVSSSTISDTNWHHYCATVSSSGVWSFYIDGIAKTISLSVYPSIETNNSCYIGGRSSAVNRDAIKNANMNQFILFNRVITSAELFHLVNNTVQVSFNALPTSPAIYVPCFLEGSKILSFNPQTNEEIYVPIETLRKGDLIKTFMSGYKPIAYIGRKPLNNPAETPERRDRLYGLYSENPQDEPLYLTGRHSTLHPYLPPEQLEIIKLDMGNIYVTENHYRLPTHLDPRSKPYTDNNPVTIWHFALEHEHTGYNYGVYANGFLVESTSIEYMLEQSNMELL